MADALIRCAAGCGRPLSFKRLQEGARGPLGVQCERCAAEPFIAETVKVCGLKDQEASAFADRMRQWLFQEAET